MKPSLLPVTKLALIASSVVPLLFALLDLFAPALVDSLLFPRPLTLPLAWKFYIASVFLGITAGAVYALRRDDWPTASAFLLSNAVFNLLAALFTPLIAVSTPGFPTRTWIYVVLAVIYVVVVITAWRQESARLS